MNSGALLLSTAVGLSIAMALAWLLQRRTGQSGWIDATWSFALGAAGGFVALAPLDGSAPSARRALVAALAIAAAWRLGFHIAARSVNAPEDPRYRELAETWGADFAARLFWFLQIQAVCAFVLSVAVFLAAGNPAPFPAITDVAGVFLVAAAIAGETWSDATLARFRASRRSEKAVCMDGPWAWSRHPNYFFQWLSWVGFAVIATDIAGAFPQGWLAWLAPVFIYWLLTRVSGVPPLEKHMLASRGAAYRDYQSHVNMFFPGPQRRA
jgi:steroid 5-alpha reductase family enzyme